MINFNPVASSAKAIFEALVCFWCVVLLFSNFQLFADSITNTVNAPKYYYALFIFALIYGLLNTATIKPFIGSPLFKWVLVFVGVIGLNMLRLVFQSAEQEVFLYELDQIQRLSLVPVIAFLCWRTRASFFDVLVPAASLIVSAVIIADFLYPGLLSPITGLGSGRAEGMHLNANAAAEAAILGAVMARNHIRPFLFTFIYVIAGMAVVFTFSRSGIAVWFMCGFLMTLGRRLPVYFLALPVVIVLGINTFSVQLEDAIKAVPEYEYKVEGMMDRLLFFQESDSSAVGEKAADDIRAQIAQSAFTSAFKKPIFGHGVDYRDPVVGVGPHNMILSLFHIYGLAGICIWGLLAWILFKGEANQPVYARLAVFVYVYFSFFSHNILEYVYWFVFIAVTLFVQNRNVLKEIGEVNRRSSFIVGNTKLGRKRKRSSSGIPSGPIRF